MSTITDSPSNGYFYPQDASVDSLKIITGTGQSVDVKYLLVELSYFEDIYNFVLSGYILLRDGIGLIEQYQLTGKEVIEVSFGKTSNIQRKVQRFRLYSIPTKNPVGNLTSEFIKLQFCSEELLLSEQTKVTQSFRGQTIKNIVTNILTDKLKVSATNINIQDTVGVYDFNIPTIKPLEAISWLSTYARPAGNNLIGADMLFFETKDGFNFKSLGTLYSAPVYKTYKYQLQNITNADQPPDEDIISVLDYEFVKTFDNLNDVASGTFANRLISLDPLTRSRTVTDFDYSKYKGASLNSGKVLNTNQNRLGKTQSQSYEGNLKMVIGNANQTTKPYIPTGSITNSDIGKDIFIETFVPNRTSQVALANHTIVKIKIPGDSNITAGRTVNFNLLSLFGGENRQLDQMYSGKYLVTAVRHILQSQGVFQTVLELAKDSTPVQASSSNYNDGLPQQGNFA